MVEYIYHGEDTLIKYYLYSLGFSGTFIKRVKYGGVTQNGTVIHMRAVIRDGDVIRITEPEDTSAILPSYQTPLSVVFEDDDILVVDKPTGMPTHPSRGNRLTTLAECVMAHFEGKPFVFRAVNRLDKDTSGLVLIAKNAMSANRLSEAMKAGLFEKEYDALIKGTPSPREGVVHAPIRREYEGAMRRTVAPDGKDAVTEYAVVRVKDNGDSLVHLKLHTGRTHQIRVHMAYLGHPLVADALYGEAETGETYQLRASVLSFPHPKTGEKMTFRLPENDEKCK